MGKKTLGRKGSDLEKDTNKDADALKEVRDCKTALPTSAEDGVKMSIEDKSKKKKKKKDKKRHEVSGNDVEFSAGHSEAVIEGDGDLDNNEKKNDLSKKRKIELNKEEKESQKARKKVKRINSDGEVSEVKEALEKTLTRVEGNMNLQMQDRKDLGNILELEDRKDRKKRHKENENKDGTDTISPVTDVLKDSKMGKVVKGKKIPQKEDIAKMISGDESDQKKKKKVVMVQKIPEKEDGDEADRNKKKKKRKRDREGGNVVVTNNMTDGKEREQLDAKPMEKVEYSRKEGKRKKKNHKVDLGADELGNESSGIENKENASNEGNANSSRNEAGGRKIEVHAVSGEDSNKDKKKKMKLMKDRSEEKGRKGVPRTQKRVETTDPSKNSTRKEGSKKVSFSDHVEVFPSDGPADEDNNQEKGLVRGKRFSREEDEMVKEAVLNFIEARALGEEGLNMVLHCKSHPEIKHCWKEIGAALPWRPYESVYYRAHILFERDEKRAWTAEEYELVRKFHEKHGSDWRMLADALGKHRFHVKDTWRRIKLPNLKKGPWSQEEYQSLFDLVNMDLRMKAFEEKKSKHGMLRDNICWGAISDKLSTRTNALCCQKWYDQLTSPLVAEGKWADADDYRLLIELFSLDASCMEEVDWDNLLEQRTGDICRKRWNQMVKHIGDHGNKSFAEQVEVLSMRYCPDVLQAREAYDSNPAVS